MQQNGFQGGCGLRGLTNYFESHSELLVAKYMLRYRAEEFGRNQRPKARTQATLSASKAVPCPFLGRTLWGEATVRR